MERRKGTAEWLMLVASGALPAAWAASRAPLVADGSHALATVRAAGLGWAGALRALDALAACATIALPLGTRTTRAALASSLALALLGVVLFMAARRLLRASAPDASPLLSASLALVASAMTTFGLGAQLEATAPGATVLGAAIALAPLAMATRAPTPATYARAAACVGLAAAEEPALGALALASAAAVVLAAWPARPSARAIGVGLVCGLAPLALPFALRATTPALSASVRALADPLGEGARSNLRAWLEAELGWVALGAAGAGAALALARKPTRPFGVALAIAASAGAIAVRLGAPAGPARFSATAIACVGALSILAGCAMQAAAIAVARVPVPFARASSVMVVLLEIAFPAKTLDDTSLALGDRAAADAAWAELAVLPLAPRALVLAGPREAVHAWLAMRASGELGPDVLVLPTFDVRGRAATHATLRDPALLPLARDMALQGVPNELSLAQIAERRPLLVAFEPRWDRAIARHLVAAGMIDRYEVEPRGSSDRRRALLAFAPARERLAGLVKADPGLLAPSASLLRARAVGAAVGGDREIIARALSDLHRVAPGDLTAAELARRIVFAKGPIDVSDLEP